MLMADIKKYEKGEDIQLSANFHLKEYECSCSNCSETLVDLDHIKKLQQLRQDLGSAIRITSAYRCPSHNKAVGGSDNSQHKIGTATDIQVSGMDPSEVQDACEKFDGLGRYDTFTHIDSRGSKARWDKRTEEEFLPDGPTEDDIDISLEDIEKDLGL
jgi:uncharacterized protein YcbK (DUF882 family)